MKSLTGLLLCIAVGLTTADHLCYTNRVFKCQWNANYAAGWCLSSLEFARCQVEAAEECNTGYADIARRVLFHLNEACDASSTLKIDLNGLCGLGFYGKHVECLSDYNKEFKRPGRNIFDAVDNERILCKYAPTINKCFRDNAENECTFKQYLAFISIMESTAELQVRVCGTIPRGF